MKRMLFLFAILVCFAGKAQAQAEIPHFASDPALCDNTRGLLYYNTTSNVVKSCTALNTWTTVGGGPIFSFSTYGGVDDDSTDNCANGAVAAFTTAVNNYSGPGMPVATIPATTKAYKLATNSNSCTFAFTRTGGVRVIVNATIRCAQTAQSCIQLGPSGQASEITGNNYYLTGSGVLLDGSHLTFAGNVAAGIYVEPGVAQFQVSGLQFGTGQYSAGAPTALFGFGTSNATLGNCPNYSIYIDNPVADGTVDHNYVYVTSPDTTHGGCGIANPGGASGGTNTITYDSNIVATGGSIAGGVQCGSIGIIDGGSYGVSTNNNIYGFAMDWRIVGVGHKIIGNQADSAGCNATAGGVSSIVHIGANGSNTSVNFLQVIGNTVQGGGGHTSNLLSIAGDSTATLQAATVSGNQNTNGTISLFPTSLGCTVVVEPCLVAGNYGFTLINPGLSGNNNGWQVAFGVVQVFAADGQGANNANVGTIAAPTGHISVFYCMAVVTTRDAVSATLPACNLNWTDAFTSVSVTKAVTATDTTDLVGTTQQSGSITLAPTAAGNLVVSTTGYASNTGGAMKYSVRALLVQY